MTEIIDLFSFSTNHNSHYPPKNYTCLQTSTLNSQNSNTSTLNPKDNKTTLLVTGKPSEHDLMFDLETTDSYMIIRVYIITKFGQILKIPTQTSKVQLIRHLSSFNSLYQPKINPLTGFVYFQFNFFHCNSHFKFHQTFRIPQLLKQISFQKLFISVKKICPSQTMLDNQKAQEQTQNQGPFSASIIKTVAGSFFNSDLDKLTLNSCKPVFNTAENYSNQSSLFCDFLQTSKYQSVSQSPFKIQNSLKEIESQQFSLSSLLKRKGGRSNYGTLLIKADAQKSLKELMINMLEQKRFTESVKIQEAELGKVTLNLQRVEQNAFRDKLIFLQSLPKNCEYHFIDKYYKPPLNVPVLISLSLKEQSLAKYLIKNSLIMSLSTRMRILLQIYSGVNVLWDESKLVYFVGNLKKVFVTKNLGVKLRGRNCYFKPQKHVMLEDKNLVNHKLGQSLLRLSQLYFQLFHHQNLFYVKPTAELSIERSLFEYCKRTKVLDRMPMNKYLTDLMNNNSKRYISSLNYLFMEQMNVANKMINESEQKKKDSQGDVWMFEKEQSKEMEFGENITQSEDQPFISTKMVACWLLSAYQ